MTRSTSFNAGRRAFLSGAPLTSEGRQRYERLHRPLGPALPWLARDASTVVCAECDGPCVAACPPGIVRRHGGDHTLSGVPYLSFEDAGCDFCGACAQVCPQIPQPVTGRPALGTARVDQGTCLAWNGVVCISCLPRCPQQAFYRDGRGRVHVDEGSCNGCGACVSVCPRQAISV